MSSHRIGELKVEVLHEEDRAEKRVDVLIIVYEGREFIDLVRFDFTTFNSAELGRQIPSLSKFPVQRLKAIIEDARCFPKTQAEPVKKPAARIARPRRKARS